MRYIVCGSRIWGIPLDKTEEEEFEAADQRWLLQDVLDSVIRDGATIIEGKANGADTLAREWAERRKMKVESYPANWEKFGKAAGPIRNQQMLDTGIDKVIAFKRGENSRGTEHMISIARATGVPVLLIQEF